MRNASVTLSRKIVSIISILNIVATIVATTYFIRLGVFKDINTLRGLVGQSVVLDPIIFMLTQTIQMAIPIIPGGVSYAAEILILGPTMGFVYDYVGIAFDSIIIFLLGRNYGKPFIMSFVSDKTYNKYVGWLDNEKHLERLFTLATFLLIIPDDALCLMAGLTKMSVKKFTLIIPLTRPASIYLYSLASVYGGTFLTSLLEI